MKRAIDFTDFETTFKKRFHATSADRYLALMNLKRNVGKIIECFALKSKKIATRLAGLSDAAKYDIFVRALITSYVIHLSVVGNSKHD